jgi:putative nucleotidyltransferase with HDIG domain
MPKNLADLPFQARAYIALVVAAGVGVLGHSLFVVAQQPLSSGWLSLAGLTVLTGSFSIKVPSIRARFSVSEAFVLAAVIVFGPSVATIIVVLDTLIVTSWIRRGQRSSIRALFNMAAGACGIWVSAEIFESLRPVVIVGPPLEELALPALVLSLSYFAINSILVAQAISFESGHPALRIWRENFAWLSLNNVGGASVAVLIVTYTQNIDLTALSIIVPLLVIIYVTFRTSLGRVEDAQRHLAQVNDLYVSAIETLALAVDAKDQVTHGHIRRVQVYAVELAKRLGVSDDRQIKAIEAAALLHDVGKLAIPEHILNKPGTLTTSEFEVIKTHADIGADLLSSIRFPYPVVPIVRHHHERWDGKGYPAGIAGPDIPIGARILSVVDCFDALNSDRPYRPKLSVEDSFAVLRERRGTMYDPWVVDSFIAVFPELVALAEAAGNQEHVVVPREVAESASKRPPSDSVQIPSQSLALLSHVRREMANVAGESDAAALVLGYAVRLTNANGGALFRYSVDANTLTVDHTAGMNYSGLLGSTLRPAEGVSGWVWANQRTIRNANAALELSSIAKGGTYETQSALSTIVRTHGTASGGVITVYSATPEPFDAAHELILERLGDVLKEYASHSARVA